MGDMETSMRTLARAAVLLFVACAATVGAADLPLDSIKLPKGFAIELVARVPGAREMALGSKGTLFVGSVDGGKVYAVTRSSGGAATVRTIASGLNRPVGVAVRAGNLYVSAVSRILRFDGIEERLDRPPDPTVVSD